MSRIKKRKTEFISGDHLMESDLTGRIMLKSDARKMWNGLYCYKDEYEIRNPQDFIKPRREQQAVKQVRTRKVEFITTPITADDL